MNNQEQIPKRTFHDIFSNGGDGVPHHVVVQYTEEGNGFMCADYFKDYGEAEKFVKEMESE